jgi:hypothetical protein
MTALLSGVVLVLVLCHTPKTIVNTYESYQVKRMVVNQSQICSLLWFRLCGFSGIRLKPL